MPIIELITFIAAPSERVFDLARSIDFHQHSTSKTQERAIGGVTNGLIDLGQEVTWSARHFGFRQNLTAKITEFERPKHFADIMLRGAFKRMEHRHCFDAVDGGTLMRDVFTFESPLWIFGQLADAVFLTRYMRNFLIERNRQLKAGAESEEWKKFL
ncbi:hypothetical protein BH09SUM1_BH09SUM1_05140 [soil metagenome]